jgi:hypothetical protein
MEEETIVSSEENLGRIPGFGVTVFALISLNIIVTLLICSRFDFVDKIGGFFLLSLIFSPLILLFLSRPQKVRIAQVVYPLLQNVTLGKGRINRAVTIHENRKRREQVFRKNHPTLFKWLRIITIGTLLLLFGYLYYWILFY